MILALEGVIVSVSAPVISNRTNRNGVFCNTNQRTFSESSSNSNCSSKLQVFEARSFTVRMLSR